jgi:undecaprenyl-diphosphatase
LLFFRIMTRSLGAVIGLFTTAAVATAGYLLVSSAVERGTSRVDDKKARRTIIRRSSKPLRIFSEATGHIGKWYLHMPVATLGAGALARTGHRQAAATLASTSVSAAAASRLLDHVHNHRTPPPGKHDPSAQSYPSGHAIETTSVAFVASWILAREQVAPGSSSRRSRSSCRSSRGSDVSCSTGTGSPIQPQDTARASRSALHAPARSSYLVATDAMGTNARSHPSMSDPTPRTHMGTKSSITRLL